jgi:hypothetical protein
VDAAVNTVAQIREAFGNEIEFGLDFHGRVSAPMAKVLIKELEQYRPLFIESRCWPSRRNIIRGWRRKRIFLLRPANACSRALSLNACWKRVAGYSAARSVARGRYYRML